MAEQRPAPIGTTEFDLLNILRAANDAADFAYLEAGTYKITSQIRITPTEYPNLKGIIGKGKGNTVITFDWAQKFDWDSNTNETDARSECGILVDGVHNKTLKDFSIRYEGSFTAKAKATLAAFRVSTFKTQIIT
ncbi:hypothetical protein [Neisseria dentiae]|uniref:hypothetical protein n=1 Tax=Neisseria dentiae TaxID=194197 RepID=UPI000E1C2730|nr:hypothetical protein [Neisseria dentiae]